MCASVERKEEARNIQNSDLHNWPKYTKFGDSRKIHPHTHFITYEISKLEYQ
jgi:hypothetical protein